MPEINGPTPGVFCWIELATSDAAAAKGFYENVFSWDVNENDMGDMGTYYIFRKSGRDAGAMYQMVPQQRAQGVPPNWLSYIAVENAAETALQAQRLGGGVLQPPFDVNDLGRMAVLHDPQGGVFAVWEAGKQWGLGIRDEDNTLCWNELATNDPEGARAFYTKLFGWTAEVSPGYTEWHRGEKGIGGMRTINEGEPTPPNWMPYFMASDCDAMTLKVKSAGGSVHVPATDIESVGRFSVVADPQGAVFAFYKPVR